MSNRNNGNNGHDEPAVFVNAQRRSTKDGDNRLYIISKTFDLDAIKQELGTNVATLKVITPRKSKYDDERLVIFSPSDPKYLSTKTAMSNATGGNGSRRTNDDYEPL